PLFNQPFRRRADRGRVRGAVGVAFQYGPAWITGSGPLLGTIGQWERAARELVHGSLPEPARTQVPTRVSGKRRFHHRSSYASHVVAVRIDSGNKDRIARPGQDRGGFLQDAARKCLA